MTNADLIIDDTVEVFRARRSENAKNVVQLVQVVLAREDGSIGEHLSQDAADRPHVNGLGIALGVEHDLGGAVPSCGNVLGEEPSVVMVWIGYSGQAKITDLRHAW